MTSKLRISIPEAIAERYEIAPGDELEWIPEDGAIRVVPVKGVRRAWGSSERVALFDAATRRQREREAMRPARAASPSSAPDWTRTELNDRGSSR